MRTSPRAMKHYCGGCSNHVDPKTAVRWVRPDGAVVHFCSEQCRVVGEDIEPPAEWAATPKGAIRDDKKVRKATMKRKTAPAARRAKKARRAAAKKSARRAPKRKS